ncbi:hypothetical protein KSS87_013688 [Heliosperma pusillum]|nr:hypothetical protein KSS87_013688 [Heliosperma pusillum]
MAEEAVIAVTSIEEDTNTNNNLKRKLEDFDEPTSAAAATPELDTANTPEIDADADESDDDAPSKRPRLDELDTVSENGHKADGENGHTEDNADSAAVVENADAAADAENVDSEADGENAATAHGDESAKVVSVEENEAELAADIKKEDNTQDDKLEEIDGQIITSGEVEQESIEKTPGDETHEPASEGGAYASTGQHFDSGSKSISKKIEIPNNKVGVLIGKAGETIRNLQINSGAKIQITRDADADPNAKTRTVELVGTSESLNKAERLIKDVIVEADAGGSPSLVARGFSAAMNSGSTEVEIPVPGDKVGLIIGRGGDTIKNLQTRSGARIQLIPQNVPGEQSKEKKVKITGDRKQVELAKELIKEVMNQDYYAVVLLSEKWLLDMDIAFHMQHWYLGVPIGNHLSVSSTEERASSTVSKHANVWKANLLDSLLAGTVFHLCMQPGRPSQFSGSNYSQQGYPPRGPGGGPQWGNRGPPTQPMPYDYHQRGPYPSQGQQYPAQSYGNYQYQGPPRSNFGPGWDHRPSAQGPPHGGGYEHYGQGGGHAAKPNAPGPHTTHHASGPNMGPPPSQGNYGYGPPRTGPPAQNYGQGYGDPKYNTPGPVQQPPYGGQGYAPQQQGYAPQQQYSRPPSYSMPSQGVPQGAYAPPTAGQPTETPSPYQAPVSGSTQPHQQYPYAPGSTTQQPYGAAPVTNDAYSQPQQVAGYTQPGAQAQPVPTYGQPGVQAQAQPVPAYGQPGAQAQPVPAYGQTVAQAQPVPAYGQQAGAYAQTPGYGYQAQVDPAAYGYQTQVDPSAYAASGAYSAPAAVAQAGYAQPVAGQPGYDQSAAQTGAYAAAAPAAPTAQTQPGYPQYDASQQMYAAPR